MAIGSPAQFQPDPIPSALRVARSIVGRRMELEAVEAAVEAARESLVGIGLEGEPGIGKSTLLNAAAEIAAGRGLTPILVAADEEIRGPLLLARAIFAADGLTDDCPPEVVAAVERVRSALAGDDDSDGITLSPDDRLLRIFDRAAVALRAIARQKPVALLLDDLQWADQDSIRLLRYVIRSNSGQPMFLMLTIRPEETAQVNELVTLLADLERLGILRRLRIDRLRQTETAALLKHLLAADVTLAAAATIHAQAEGVPFIVQELTRAYREAGLLQRIGQSWSLARHAERLVPSAVRTLIQRRAAALRPETKELLATGAVLGRAFRVADVCALRSRMGESSACEVGAAAELLEPALAAGLISEAGSEANRHITFAHEQVRAYALDTLPSARRRAMHAAVVDSLTEDMEPTAETLPIIVRHALAAGDTERIARFSLDAARAALTANAPEEALRLVEEALGAVSNPSQRIEMLRIRDEALATVGRPAERLEAIAELIALVEAAGDTDLELDAHLRRAGALRADHQYERAAEVARRVRLRAAAAGNAEHELAACLELGQDLLRSTLGEGYVPSPHEADIDSAREAFERAAELAAQIGSDAKLAVATRELGVIKLAGVRAWFVERIQAGEHIEMMVKLAKGAILEDLERELPIWPDIEQTEALLTHSLELFERAGDRRGAMSAIVSLAYLRWGAELHFGSNPAQRFEGIRQLTAARDSLVQESEREAAEAQMLYGVHVFARSKLIPDLAIGRGEEAYRRARALGDQTLEFLSAIGTARAQLDVGDVDQADAWLARAADAAAVAPTPHRARQLAICQALIAAARGNTALMRENLERAARMAAGQRRPAAQCETLALLALEASRAGAAASDEELLGVAETAAREARRLAAELAGHPLWSAQADAAESRVALARGDQQAALELARAALDKRQAAMREDPHLEILLPAARTIMAAGEPAEQQQVKGELQLIQAQTAQRTLDEQVRARWFRGPLGGELAALAGPFEPSMPASKAGPEQSFDERESRLLRLLVEGRSNREIGEELGLDEAAVARTMTALYARIGTTSRAETTAFAFRTGAV